MVHADQYIDLKFPRRGVIYGRRKTYIILGKFKIVLFLENKWKIHFYPPFSESTQPAVVSIFKKSDKIHKFSDFFPGSIWVSTQHQKGGMLQGKCLMSNCGASTVWRNGRADDHETGGGGTMDPPRPRYPAPESQPLRFGGECSVVRPGFT